MERRREADDLCADEFTGVSVSQVARRYEVNTNLVFIWLRDERYNVEPEDIDVARFLPVEVIEPDAIPEPALEAPTPVLELALAGGLRITVRGGFDPHRLGTLIKKLSS